MSEQLMTEEAFEAIPSDAKDLIHTRLTMIVDEGRKELARGGTISAETIAAVSLAACPDINLIALQMGMALMDLIEGPVPQ